MRSLSIKLIILGTSRDLSAENFFNVSNRATIARLKAKRAISGTAEFIETKDVEAQGHEPVNAEIIMRQKDTDELTSLYCFEHATPPDVIIAVFDAASRLSLEGIEKALGVLKGMEIGCAFWVVADTAGVWEAVGGGTRLRDIRIPSVDAGVAEGLALAARCGCGFSVISSERYEDVDGVKKVEVRAGKGI
ncbi:hypothetical protein BDV19DRAFT_388487 [Aspergillus venezuelensis]